MLALPPARMAPSGRGPYPFWPSTSPDSTPRPFRKTEAGIRFFEAGWTVRSRSSSSPQATEKDSFSTVVTVPGAAAVFLPVTRDSQTLSRRPSGRYVKAPGTGSKPRTRLWISAAGRCQSISAMAS